jgi:hypothetical protein
VGGGGFSGTTASGVHGRVFVFFVLIVGVVVVVLGKRLLLRPLVAIVVDVGATVSMASLGAA